MIRVKLHLPASLMFVLVLFVFSFSVLPGLAKPPKKPLTEMEATTNWFIGRSWIQCC